MLRIAIVCHAILYHNLINAVSGINPNVTFSPALSTWNDVIDWLNREGADGIVLEKGIPFADRVLTMRFPTAVFAGNMNQFIHQYRMMVERLMLEVPKSLVPPQMEEKQEEKREATDEEGHERKTRATIKIPIFGIETEGKKKPAAQDITVPADTPETNIESKGESEEPENIRPDEPERNEEKPFKPTLVKGLGEGLAKAFRDGANTIQQIAVQRRKERINAVEYQAIPHRIVFYSPKGGAGVTTSVLALAEMTGAGVLEIAYPYCQMAGILGVNPEWTLANIPDGKEQMAVYRKQFLFSPWVYPIREPWDKEVARSWLQKGMRAFPDRMILVDLYSSAPLPILAEVFEWATRVVWILKDSETDLGMADVQLRNLKKMMEVDDIKWSMVVQSFQGKKLPWEDVLGIPLLTRLPEMGKPEWEKEWQRAFHTLIARGRSLRLSEPREA